jgi:hypothetical protein
MRRTMVGLLAAVGAIMAALVSFIHGDSDLAVLLAAGAATGLASYLAIEPGKKNSSETRTVGDFPVANRSIAW